MLFKILPMIFYFGIGVMSFVMAYKNLTFKKFIAFHEEAAGISLDTLNQKTQNIILALMKTTGMGFLTVGLLLFYQVAICYLELPLVDKIIIPAICAAYCLGLFAINYQLYKISGAQTPWKASIVAVLVIVASIVMTI
jgi:hypothetical protein